MISTHEILEKSRAAGQRLPYNEAAVLFAGAVRLAAASDSTLRGRLVRIDDAGGLHVEGFDEQAPEAEPAYLAPELLSANAPDKNDPKVQVYAAGVLGYELLTGRLAPPPGQAPGPELTGPLGDVVRRALAADRRERIEDLRQLHEAVEEIQPRPPTEGERNILSALRNRFSRPPPGEGRDGAGGGRRAGAARWDKSAAPREGSGGRAPPPPPARQDPSRGRPGPRPL